LLSTIHCDTKKQQIVGYNERTNSQHKQGICFATYQTVDVAKAESLHVESVRLNAPNERTIEKQSQNDLEDATNEFVR
jgi:hypothetical protein